MRLFIDVVADIIIIITVVLALLGVVWFSISVMVRFGAMIRGSNYQYESFWDWPSTMRAVLADEREDRLRSRLERERSEYVYLLAKEHPNGTEVYVIRDCDDLHTALRFLESNHEKREQSYMDALAGKLVEGEANDGEKFKLRQKRFCATSIHDTPFLTL